MHLLSLIGEQPIPNLLVSRALAAGEHVLCCTPTTRRVADHLASLMPGALLQQIEPYHLPTAQAQIEALCRTDTVLNLTGGTKPMAIAAYEAARRKNLPFVYWQSEKLRSRLDLYRFFDGLPRLDETRELGTLLDIHDYLQAHGLQPGRSRLAYQNIQEKTLLAWFRQHVDEVLSNVVFDAFEVDFILRRGNQVAIVETKDRSKSTRFGIDQLNTAGGRTYLGAYTVKIWIVRKMPGHQLTSLAEARNIHIVPVALAASETGLYLDTNSGQRLAAVLLETLGPRIHHLKKAPSP